MKYLEAKDKFKVTGQEEFWLVKEVKMLGLFGKTKYFCENIDGSKSGEHTTFSHDNLEELSIIGILEVFREEDRLQKTFSVAQGLLDKSVKKMKEAPKYKLKPASALDVQVGGSHYPKDGIQPIEYIHANKLGFIEGCVVKYITRFREKNGQQDLEKIKHYIDLLIELEYSKKG